MGFFSGVATAAGSVASVATSVLKTVTGAGVGIFKGLGTIAKSLPGKIMIGAGAGLALKGIVDANAEKSGNGKSGGFDGFFGSIKNSVENLIGGAATLFKNIADKMTGKSDKNSIEDGVEERDDEQRTEADGIAESIAAESQAPGIPESEAGEPELG